MYVSYGATVHGPDMIGFTSETLRPQVIAEVLVRDYCIVAPPGVRLGETMELFSVANRQGISTGSLWLSSMSNSQLGRGYLGPPRFSLVMS